MIQYTIAKKTVTINGERKVKYYAKIVRPSTMTTREVAALLAERTTIEESEVYGYLQALVRVIKNGVTNSIVVETEALGRFTPALKATMQPTAAAVTHNTITHKGVNYRPTAEMMRNIKADAKFTKANLDVQNITGDTTSGGTSSTTTTYTLTAVSANTAQGSVSGGGTYAAGTVVTLVATPASGYTFSRWSDGSTEASRQVTVTADATYTAEFAASGSGSMDD